MARKKRYQYEENIPEDDAFISRSQKKRASSALQLIGEELAHLPLSQLANLPLSEDLENAFAEYRRITDREGKRRLLQYVGKLMREAQDQAALDGTEDIVKAYLEMRDNL